MHGTTFQANGGNPAFIIMQFNPIRETFFKTLEAKVGTAPFDEMFIAQAKERSQLAVEKRAVDTEEPVTTLRALHDGSTCIEHAPMHVRACYRKFSFLSVLSLCLSSFSSRARSLGGSSVGNTTCAAHPPPPAVSRRRWLACLADPS